MLPIKEKRAARLHTPVGKAQCQVATARICLSMSTTDQAKMCIKQVMRQELVRGLCVKNKKKTKQRSNEEN
jgi:hypothetical protein